MHEEMETLTARYRTLRENMLESSPVYKKLHQLAKQKKPQNTRTLISEELWEQIKQQAQKIYPGLRKYVIDRCPDLSESEWAYCCLYLFGFTALGITQIANVGAYRIRPDAPTYPRGRFRAYAIRPYKQFGKMRTFI